MATNLDVQAVELIGTAPPGPYAGLNPHRFTVREFEKILDANVFHPDRRFELLAGFVVEKHPRGVAHNYAVMVLGDRLRAIVERDDWLVLEEKSVLLGSSWRLGPDLVVVRGPARRYATAAPRPADIGLVIEVADEASYRRDLGTKRSGYARAGLPAYGILNMPGRRFELYGKPTGRGRLARYEERTDYGVGDAFPVAIDGAEVGRVAVAELLA